MKRTLLLTVFLLVRMSISYCQNIPDANFAAAIRTVCPTCIDGSNNLLAPAQSLVKLDVSNKSISSLTGLNGFTGLKELNCSYNQITSLPSLPLGLINLYCWNNKITSLPTFPTTLYQLNCSSNQLTSLPTLHDGLRYVTCNLNQITTLPTIPNTVAALECRSNKLTSLPILPPNLVDLNCKNNLLTILPSLPNAITYLECDSNKLTTLPVLPTNLKILTCISNQLTSLPSLPSGLTFLMCWFNQLTSLPTLPSSLQSLYCGNNPLTSVPTLPNSLQAFTCNTANLTVLPTLPNSITLFDCGWNKITAIPNVPTSIIDFYCYENLLTTIPALPSGIKTLECYSNQLTSLPSMPASLTKLSCGHNNLTTIPGSLNYIELRCDYTNIQCLPTLGNGLTTLWVPNTLNCLPNIPTSLTDFRKYTGAYGTGIYSSTILPVCTPNNYNLACLGQLTLTLDQNCQATLRPEDILTGADASCALSQGVGFELRRTTSNGVWSAWSANGVSFNASDINKNIPCAIQWGSIGANCWGYVKIQDRVGGTCAQLLPSITQCPANISVNLTNSGDCNAAMPNMLSGFQATANCSTATPLTYSQSPVAGTTLSGHGTVQTAIFTATDGCGLTSNCTATVTLQDKRPPSILVHNITVTLPTPSAQATITVNDVLAWTIDNCTPSNQIQTSLSKSTFTCADAKVSPVQIHVNVTDLAGNSDYAIAMITVVDNANLCPAIPVELLYFKGKNTEGGHFLTWETATETKSSHYDIESSTDGKNFEKIATVKAKGHAAYYEFLNRHPLSITSTYYQLKMNDLDSKSSYSNIISISPKDQLNIKVYPNPTKAHVTLDLGDAHNATVRLTDILGREIQQKEGQSGQVTLDLSNLSSSIYFAEITVNGLTVREKVIKN